jgi:hypothetical protein
LHVTFDVTDFADGTTRTDVQFNNDYAEQPTGGAVTYDETITQNGAVVSQYANVTQYQYQTRHEVFWSNGAPQVSIIHDIAALEKTGAIPGYNLAYSSTASSLPIMRRRWRAPAGAGPSRSTAWTSTCPIPAAVPISARRPGQVRCGS